MKTLTADKIFKEQYQGEKNVMTPHIIKRGKMCRNVAYELSEGRGIFTPTLYGVTIVIVDESNGRTEPLFSDSKCFDTREDAQAYIEDYKQRC